MVDFVTINRRAIRARGIDDLPQAFPSKPNTPDQLRRRCSPKGEHEAAEARSPLPCEAAERRRQLHPVVLRRVARLLSHRTKGAYIAILNRDVIRITDVAEPPVEDLDSTA